MRSWLLPVEVIGKEPYSRLRLLCHQLQVLRLPLHGIVNPVAAAGMIEEYPLLHWARTHLAIFAQMNRTLGETIRLPAGIEPVHVGLVLLRPNKSIDHRRQHKDEDQPHEYDQWKHRSIADAANLPPLSPLCQRPVEHPIEKGKQGEDADGKKEGTLIHVVEHIVSHLVSHYRLNLFRRAPLQQIVVQRDAQGVAKSA